MQILCTGTYVEVCNRISYWWINLLIGLFPLNKITFKFTSGKKYLATKYGFLFKC